MKKCAKAAGSLISVSKRARYVAAGVTAGIVASLAAFGFAEEVVPNFAPPTQPLSPASSVPPNPSLVCYVRETHASATCCDYVEPAQEIPCGPSTICGIVRAGVDNDVFQLNYDNPGWTEDKFGESNPPEECLWFPPRCVQDSTGYNCTFIPILHRTGCWSWGPPQGPQNCE
ncbi:MAG: hypothetical protein SGJ11_12820 [Phycisphaerae bacterium]|nr:hypothetical protein [Phycisphaerae bacterium]